MINRFNVKKLLTLLLCCLIISLTSCAKTVTLKETAGTNITFSITFDTAPDFNNYQYYIIYGSSTFDLNTSLSSNYFFIPGESVNQATLDAISGGQGLNDFYTKYFKSWGGILTLKSTDISITKGPFSESTSTDAQHFGYTATNISMNDYEVKEKTISFTIAVSELNISENILYFSIGTSKGDLANNTQDLVTDIQSIEIIANRPSLFRQNDTSLYQPESAAKIISWTVTVL
tara:strand:+ start:1475 stop:2170 length:696 start_codon:yes stop_codon:yes gene_type:complete